MKTIYVNGDVKPENNDKYALCAGMFDGVHGGHRYLIEKTIKEAAKRGIKSGVVTFADGGLKNRIYLLEQQVQILEKCGVDALFVISFNEEFKNTPPEKFIEEYLFGIMRAEYIICGEDFRFGKDRTGDSKLLCDMFKKHGAFAETVCKISVDEKMISSTEIRNLLGDGKISEANRLLTENYHISGCVREGFKIGRTIGYPTVNIYMNDELCNVKNGVYKSLVTFDGKRYLGLTNIGTAPTANKQKRKVCETYITDFAGNLYNKYIDVSLLEFLREEKKFDSIEELKENIRENVMQVMG